MTPPRRRFVWEIDWNLLRTFMVIVQERGLTAAGEKLSLKQPTVSYHLKQLLDAGLVSREKRGSFAYFSLVPEAFERVRALLDVPALAAA